MITSWEPSAQPSTRERLLSVGLALFAAKGFGATTVGEIEQAAGLQPRRGGLYRHFASKEALLEAAIERQLEAMTGVQNSVLQAPALKPGVAAALFGRWLLADLDAQQAMTHLMEREGNRLIALRDRFCATSQMGFALASQLIRRWLESSDLQLDADVAAAVLIGGLINYRRSRWTLGAAPLDLDDEAFLLGFSELAEALFDKAAP